MTQTAVPVTKARLRGSRPVPWITAPRLLLAGSVLAALLLRYALLDIQPGDYRAFLDPWYRHLQQASGLSGLADVNSNYNTPYLVLLALISKVPITELIAIKSISVIFDLLLAYIAFKIIAVLGPGSSWPPTLAAGVALFLPTVVMNSSAWGQCDAIYASLCLGSLYFLIKRQAWPACVLFGLAFAFKLQAIFFLPVLLGVLVINKLRIRALLAVPVVFLAALLPAALAGRGLLTQLLTYPNQTTDSRGGGGQLVGRTDGTRAGSGGGFCSGGANGGRFGNSVGTGHPFTDNAPTWYAWPPGDASSVWT